MKVKLIVYLISPFLNVSTMLRHFLRRKKWLSSLHLSRPTGLASFGGQAPSLNEKINLFYMTRKPQGFKPGDEWSSYE